MAFSGGSGNTETSGFLQLLSFYFVMQKSGKYINYHFRYTLEGSAAFHCTPGVAGVPAPTITGSFTELGTFGIFEFFH